MDSSNILLLQDFLSEQKLIIFTSLFDLISERFVKSTHSAGCPFLPARPLSCGGGGGGGGVAYNFIMSLCLLILGLTLVERLNKLLN